MKAPLVYSLYLEVQDGHFPTKYREAEIMDYAVRRLGGDTVALPENSRWLQYEELKRLYDLSYDQIETLFVPYKFYGVFPEMLEEKRIDKEPFSVYPKAYDWDYYREAWLAYFPMWLVLWGWHPDDFRDCAYWVISASVDREVKEVSIYYGLENDAEALERMLRSKHNGTSWVSRFENHALAQVEKSLLQPEAKKIRPIVTFGG